MSKEKIIHRIKKLLDLANSDNEHEAKMAAEKANELLVRHNIEMQDVSKHGEKEYVVHEHPGNERLPKDKAILLTIMKDHFFIDIVLQRKFDDQLDRSIHKIVFIGEKSNVEIANYVYPFLLRSLRNSFSRRKLDGELIESDRESYATGFALGLKQQLEIVKAKTEESMALVLVDDPGLKKFSMEKYPPTSKPRVISGRTGPGTDHGIEDGKSVKIRKGITESPNQSGLQIEGPK